MFSRFNLITGTNGTGKSSMLQPLLMMWQSIDRNAGTEAIYFNGSYIDLGTFQQIRNVNTLASEAISWTFAFKNEECNTVLKYTLRAIYEGMSAHIELLTIDVNLAGNSKQLTFNNSVDQHSPHSLNNQPSLIWDRLLPAEGHEYPKQLTAIRQVAAFHRIHYVSADRLGPQDHYDKQSVGDFVHVGARGQQVGSVLYVFKDDVVADELCIAKDKGVPSTLQDQTEAWLARLFGYARIQPIDTGANVILLELGTDVGKQRFRPKNVGFGYSTALPIVVSCLLAKPGDILIIENPEAHLHPAAQSALMHLLVKVSNLGVQVFIESHSDHILNSIRVAVKREDIQPEAATVYYFSRSDDNPVQKLEVDKEGSIASWPYGFFDQTERDYYELYGV